MAAIIAPHHGAIIDGYLVDRYLNDPWTFDIPFLWSHCHARYRKRSFGESKEGPYVHGKDVAFFVTYHPETNELVCDCVFVVGKVISIMDAQARYAPAHPVRHFHFDQDRNPHHLKSELTRIADKELSFVPHPAMPIGPWIEEYVAPGKKTVHEYFAGKRIKNVRVIVRDAQGIYDQIVEQSHQRLSHLPLLLILKLAEVHGNRTHLGTPSRPHTGFEVREPHQ